MKFPWEWVSVLMAKQHHLTNQVPGQMACCPWNKVFTGLKIGGGLLCGSVENVSIGLPRKGSERRNQPDRTRKTLKLGTWCATEHFLDNCMQNKAEARPPWWHSQGRQETAACGPAAGTPEWPDLGASLRGRVSLDVVALLPEEG